MKTILKGSAIFILSVCALFLGTLVYKASDASGIKYSKTIEPESCIDETLERLNGLAR